MEGTKRDAASDDENRLTFCLDEARHAATEHTEKNKTDEDDRKREWELPEHPPSLDVEDMQIVLQRS